MARNREVYVVKRLDLFLHPKPLHDHGQLSEVFRLEEYGSLYDSIYRGVLKRQMKKPLSPRRFQSLTAQIQRRIGEIREHIEEERQTTLPMDYMVMYLYDQPAEDGEGRILAKITESNVDIYPPR